MAKKEKECEVGSPAWMTTFGDMMTLLLTFFVLLFSMATISEKKFAEVLGSIESAFGIGANITSPDPVSIEEVIERLLNIPPALENSDGLLVENLEGYNLKVTTIEDGVKLTAGGQAVFEKNSAVIMESAKPVLRQIASKVGGGYRNRIQVVGHASPDETWPDGDLYALSYARADAVRRFLIDPEQVGEENRVLPARIEVVAAGPFQPATANVQGGESNVGSAGLERSGRIFNRRVDIIVTEERINQELFR